MGQERHPVNIQQLSSEFGSDDERDLNTVDTIVVHSMYNPESNDPYIASSCKEILDLYELSTHYLIDREGTVWQLVSENRRAWHAGVSQMPEPDNRESVNTFSIGVELIANETDGFTDEQYDSLVYLTSDLVHRLPITSIVGHSDIAPDRRTDPWNFDWGRYESKLNDVVDTDGLQVIGAR